MGSKPIGYYTLLYLIENKNSLNCDVSAVLTNDNLRFNNDLSIKELCKARKIQIIDSLEDFLEWQQETDIIISIQYHRILKPEHISKAKQIAVNLHMAPVPEYRGCNQFSFAIINQEKEFGTTIHRLEAGIDNGDIIAESRFEIPDNCWVEELYKLTYDKSLELFKNSIKNIIDGKYELIPQESFRGKRKFQTYYRKDIAKIKEISLDWPEEKINRYIRATSMPGFEPAYTIVSGKKVYFSNTP